MKTKIIAALLIASFGLALTACDAGSASEIQNSDTTASSLFESDGTFDVGDFTVLVPAGWIAEPMENTEDGEDIFGPHSNFTDAIMLIKNEKSAQSIYRPTVEPIYFSDRSAQNVYDSIKNENNTVGPADNISVNGIVSLVCYEYAGADTDAYAQTHVMIPLSDNSCFHVVIDSSGDVSREAEISVTDSDVVKILESLKVK